MPAKNSIKEYSSNGYYHIYNRGVEKRNIFIDTQDYKIFLSYLKEYLLPKDKELLLKHLSAKSIDFREKGEIIRKIRLNNFHNTLRLISFCLMPNHFHFLVYQSLPYTIDSFMNSLNSRYVGYFNRRYKRVGPLYQGVYKAVLVKSDMQLINLSAYIHNNPLKLYKHRVFRENFIKILKSQPSSIDYYLNNLTTEWVHAEVVTNLFNKNTIHTSYLDYLFTHRKIDTLLDDIRID